MEDLWCSGLKLPHDWSYTRIADPREHVSAPRHTQKSLKEPLLDQKFGHLHEDEQEILRRQLSVPKIQLGFFGLYGYATVVDKAIIAISVVCAIVGGAIFPLMTIVFGSLVGTFSDFEMGKISGTTFRSNISSHTVYFIYLALGEFVTIYICMTGFIYVGMHVTQKIREQYLAAILRQNISFFDSLGSGEVTTRLTSDMNLVQDAISEKVCLTITQLATFLSAFVIAYIEFWKMGLISTATIVFMFLSIMFIGKFIGTYARNSIQAVGKGGTVAEEVIRSIKAVVAFGNQEVFAARYDMYSGVAEKWGTKVKLCIAFTMASITGAIMLNYGLNFWMGSRFLVDGEVTLNKIVTIIYAIVAGAMSIATIAPYIQAFASGVAAASRIFATIARESPMDPSSTDGYTLDHDDWISSFQFRNVKLIYPSRPETVVLHDLSLNFEAGKTTALVGPSGSGKSSIINLIERFSEPVSGDILMSGRDIKSLNLRWLRRQVSLVSQEPVLFSTTVFENIKYGLVGSAFENASEEVLRHKVMDAALMANAHDFILRLPQGYDTSVGESGGILSGGQKQRIAIARAVISDPRILLLDEATSALDTRSEAAVQQALDAAARGRTTIVIAHRLSTIRDADRIVVMEKGRAVEAGRHDELVANRGLYYKLVEAQQLRDELHGAIGKGVAPRGSNNLFSNSNRPSSLSSAYSAYPHSGLVSNRHSGYSTYRQSGISTYRRSGPPESPITLEMLMTIERNQSTENLISGYSKSQPPAPELEPIHDEQQQQQQNVSMWRIVKFVTMLNKPEWFIMAIGFFFSVVAGGAAPVQALFFSKSIASLSAPPSQFSLLRHRIDFWALMYLMLGGVQVLAYVIHGWLFAVASERLIHRARDKAFRSIIRQDIAFFDKEENSVGALTTFLGQQSRDIAGFGGSTLSTFLIAITTIVAAVGISVGAGWKLGLVCTATVPVLIGCGYLRFKMLATFQAHSRAATEKSAAYACEATSAISTVTALTLDEHVWNNYHTQLEAQVRGSLLQTLGSTSLYAASQSLPFLALALGFWYGGTLVSQHQYSLFEFFLCFTEITVSSQSAGNAFVAAPDLGKAKNAALNLMRIFNQRPAIDSWARNGRSLGAVHGRLDFENVQFKYHTRRTLALKNLNLTIMPGEFVALVGPSGCGKSTTLNLIERFYDPKSGRLLIDGQDVATLDVSEYRSHLALVSQQPTLYQGTIYENVVLGARTDEAISERDVIDVCIQANIWDFIRSLPQGLHTPVGPKGALLSGGQKQRVAIARALLRRPQILLLDEATSALDSESERVVQAALDAASSGRTTVAVAHRLSSVQKADRIYVFDEGEVVEWGTHGELMGMGGRYAELARAQNLDC